MSLTPAELSLPPKFPAYRQGQLELALSIYDSGTRFDYLSAPTGSGKSLTYATVAQLVQGRTLVLVGTKGLQNQLMADFRSIGMRDVRGASNYICRALDENGILSEFGFPGTTCDDAPCKVGEFCPMKREGGCDYYDAQTKAHLASMVVTNYAFWLTIARQADPDALGKFDLLICDEAHTADTWLSEFCSVNLDQREIRALLSMDLPPIEEGVDAWVAWARKAKHEADYRVDRLKVDKAMPKPQRTRQLLRLGKLSSSFADLSRAHGWKNAEGTAKDLRVPGMEVDWIAQRTQRGQKFSPVWAHTYAEDTLFRNIPKVVLSSATLSPAVGKYLGIPQELATWHEGKSTFSRKRRPFYICGNVRMDHRTMQNDGLIQMWVNRIDSVIASRFKDRKGIIHTVSYERARLLAQRSRYGQHMLWHDQANTREVVEKFKRASPPAILVSPSMVEGFDFPDDECRWVIIAKVPFPDGRDLLFKARKKSDQNYGSYLASIAVMQMTGRGMRSKDDWCEIFVCDEHFGWFSRTIVWPAWFKEAWLWKRDVPPPMPVPQV